MEKALEIFEQICKIPHGSHDLDALKAWLVDYGEKIGCEVKTDGAKNIYMKKGTPKVCFQGHYDMVAVGNADKKLPIKTLIKKENGVNMMHAENSSLGADNGIAVAAILALFEKYTNFEALITSDEETGMFGAKECDLKVEAKTMINLDSETFGEIVVGCAGGFDAVVELDLHESKPTKKQAFMIKTKGFKGGHSGIQIGLNIKNAISELAHFCFEHSVEIAEFQGGEKRNSIPVNASALVLSDEDLSAINCPLFDIEKSDAEPKHIYKGVAEILFGIHSGVLAFDEEGGHSDVLNSRNLAIVKCVKGHMHIEIMARANRKEMLFSNRDSVLSYFSLIDAKKKDIAFPDLYMPWENDPEVIKDSKLLKMLKGCFEHPEIVNIHAGLECGILQERLEDLGITGMEIFSIGPNIYHPHSVDECLDVDSFGKIYVILEDILKKLQ